MAVPIPETAIVAELPTPAAPEPLGVELTGRTRRRLPSGVLLPGGFLVLLVAACFLWPLVYTMPPPVDGDFVTNLAPLSAGHIFGTDPLGNDVFSRILYGGRVSIEVGFGAAALGMIVGGPVGAFAAFKGGLIEAVIMRVLDVLLAFPALVLALVVAVCLGRSELNVIFAISFFSVPANARIARAATLREREQVYVLASRLNGAGDGRLLLRHVTPNIGFRLITFGLLGVPVIILIEAALDFLSLGVPPPNPSWGNMISTGFDYLTTSPMLVIIPAAFLFVTVLCVNRLGDALRAAWDVR